MSTLKYTTEHEWLRQEDDGSITIGITDYAQDQLGDIVYVELPALAQQLAAGDQLVVIESVKAVGEIAAPIAATVSAVNDALTDSPEQVNTSPLGDGWLVVVKPAAEATLKELMDQAAYEAWIATLSEAP